MKNFFKSSDNLALSLFHTFLKQNRAYGSFMCNLSKSPFSPSAKDFERLNPDSYITTAFYWGSTPEGSDYWSFLDCKWQLVLNLFKL